MSDRQVRMTSEAVTSALSAAAIPPERWGSSRVRSLGDGERALCRWILARFGAGSPPGPEELADAATGTVLGGLLEAESHSVGAL